MIATTHQDASEPTTPFAKPICRPGRASLGNVEIDLYSQSGFIEELLHHALTEHTTRQVATVNAQFYVLAEKLSSFRACLRRAEYLCADGMSIVWACRRFANLTVPRIAGVDLILDLCQAGAQHKLQVFFVGGCPGTAEATAQVLKDTYPGLEVAGVLCPHYGFETDPRLRAEALASVAAAAPHVLFLALGAPRQEIFIDQYIRPLGIPLAVGIGGSFEILSGLTHRAPRWMQERGFEWLYRFVQEPRRLWRRYLVGNAEFLWCVLKWRYREHGRAIGAPSERQPNPVGGANA